MSRTSQPRPIDDLAYWMLRGLLDRIERENRADGWMTPSEIAHKLNVTVDAVRKAGQQGRIGRKEHRTGRGKSATRYLYSFDDAKERFIEPPTDQEQRRRRQQREPSGNSASMPFHGRETRRISMGHGRCNTPSTL